MGQILTLLSILWVYNSKSYGSSFKTNITESFSFIPAVCPSPADKVAPDSPVLFHSQPFFPTCHGQSSWAAEPAAASFALNAQSLNKWYQPNFFSHLQPHTEPGELAAQKPCFSFISLCTFCSETPYRDSAGCLLCSPTFSTFERFNTP